MFKAIFNFLFGKSEPEVEVTEVEIPAKEPAKPKLPSNAKMKALKKAELEALGKEFGIDLDMRKTKDNMIKDLKKHVSG